MLKTTLNMLQIAWKMVLIALHLLQTTLDSTSQPYISTELRWILVS